MIFKQHAYIFWFSWWKLWTVCNLKFLVLSLFWLTKFNCGLVKLNNMIFILLSGHYHVEVFVIVKEVDKLFSFLRHISCTFGRSRVPWKRKNTDRGLKKTLCCSLIPSFNFALRLKMRLHHTNIQLYTVMKISNHEKWKHISINKLFLYLFVCKFLMLYYCNFNMEIVTINLDLFVQIYKFYLLVFNKEKNTYNILK